MAAIFISYRREDTGPYAGRLFDRLKGHFGDDNVFLDVEAGRAGNFVETIKAEAGSCKDVIVLIGEKWLAIADKKGTRRLDNPDDYVRIECRIGLQRNILLIPATIEHATLPGKDELPLDIAKLIEQNAAVIRYERFTADVDALIEMIEKTVPRVGDSKGVKRGPAFNWTGFKCVRRGADATRRSAEAD